MDILFRFRSILPKGLLRIGNGLKYKIGLSRNKDTTMQNAGETIFDAIYDINYWGNKESRSGDGSDLKQTQFLRSELRKLCTLLEIDTMLDIPCGDFHWMSHADLTGINYKGGDIVPAIVERNRSLFLNNNLSFFNLDLTKDTLPKADLIFSRDCLVHLSYQDINKAIANIRQSGATWLLTTSYPKTWINYDIITGDWRAINLQLPPFKFPNPITTIKEGSTEGKGFFTDKSMMLWKIKDLPK